MKSEKKLFLLDAFALIYRAYFAFAKNPRINSKGLDTSAVFGFVNTLNEVIKKEKVKLKSKGILQPVRQLSGGNQQKIVFARAIQANPKLLLLDEPTRGVDIGAKYDIYLLVRELSAQGCSVLLTSSDLPEVLGICDRVLVMQEGCQTHLLDRDEMTSADLLSYFYAKRETEQ